MTHRLDRLADGQLGDVGLAGGLDVLGQQAQLDVLDAFEPLVALVERVDKVLNLGHREFSAAGG